MVIGRSCQRGTTDKGFFWGGGGSKRMNYNNHLTNKQGKTSIKTKKLCPTLQLISYILILLLFSSLQTLGVMYFVNHCVQK